MNKHSAQAAGLALILGLGLAQAAQAVEVYNNGKDARVEVGARFQLQGVFENSTSTDYLTNTAGGTNRDYTRIFLFQPENRLKLDAQLEGMTFKFENAMGGEAYAGTNNLYDLLELSGEFPVMDGVSVVAGLSKMPDNNASAAYEENLLFTSRSQLLNLFFNKGYDTAIYAKARLGIWDAILGTEQGVPNLPQRYIPERLMLPPPVFIRIGAGNIMDDPARFKQQGFEKTEGPQWALHANGYWLADSSAGHGTLFGNLATQAEATKGPFVNGNFMFSKYYNPFMGYTTGAGAQAQSNAQYWQASLDGQLRLPHGENWLVFGAQYSISQYVNKDMNYPGAQPLINSVKYNYGQITAQGLEFYAGYLSDKWWLATRVDTLLPDPMMMVKSGGKYVQIFGAAALTELTFPSVGYHLNRFAKLTAELEHNFQAVEAIDTDGIYQLKTVPVEASLAVFKRNPYQLTGRLMFQVAF